MNPIKHPLRGSLIEVREMTEELGKLSKTGETEPHAAYAAFMYGWKHK